MKKLLLFIVPTLILMNACNNKPKSDDGGATSADSAKIAAPAAMAADTGVTGNGTSAIVFVDKTNYVGVNAVTVQAIQNGKVVATATTNENGQYTYTNLAAGTYSFAAVTNGKVYKNDTMQGNYSTTSPPPAIALDSIGK